MPQVCVKKLQNLCSTIKNLFVFPSLFNVVSFSSSDFTVPTNICKKIPLGSDFTVLTNMCRKSPNPLIRPLKVYKFLLRLSEFYQFSEEIKLIVCTDLYVKNTHNYCKGHWQFSIFFKVFQGLISSEKIIHDYYWFFWKLSRSCASQLTMFIFFLDFSIWYHVK